MVYLIAVGRLFHESYIPYVIITSDTTSLRVNQLHCYDESFYTNVVIQGVII